MPQLTDKFLKLALQARAALGGGSAERADLRNSFTSAA